MELESIGLLGDCFKPDATHPFNYMLDTSAINKLAERPEDYKILLKAKEDSLKFLESTNEDDIKLRYEIISNINDA